MKLQEKTVFDAWEQFVNTGVLDADRTRTEIMDSWHRCREAGVDPYGGCSSRVLQGKDLSKLLRSKRELVSVTRPFMENIYKFVAGSGFIVMLSDENGIILEALGDRDIHQRGMEVNLVPGSSWVESEAGTNGVGTVLVVQKPVQVSGAEHYCQKLHDWTCSAAPVFDEHSRFTGVLQMSGPSHASHLHTLGMVVAAVKAIEEQIKVNAKNRELMIVSNRINNLFLTMSDGVIFADRQGVIQQVNPSAERILHKPHQKLEGQHIKEVLGDLAEINEMLASGKSLSRIEVMLESEKGQIHCLVSGKALQDAQGDISGGVIAINPINEIKKLVNRFSGAQARFSFENIIGSSAELREAVRIARMASENDSNVLLEGESGTGKEVFAQAIHNQSRRRRGPFVALNCAAIPRDLMASELFGYVEGAFTGAQRGGRPGKFELASGGTLFLDEIGDMTMGKQGALLRAIQEKKIVRIGGNREIPVDVRIICATNKNLKEAVEKGNFREDLYYRLNVISISLPPLRRNPEDIPELFDHFVHQISQRVEIDIHTVDGDVVPVLMRYPWPGNIRELQNVVERMVCVSRDGRLRVTDLPGELLKQVTGEDTGYTSGHSHQDDHMSVFEERNKRKQQLEEIEQQEITELLTRYGGNITRVARAMGVSRNTIYRKIRHYNMLL